MNCLIFYAATKRLGDFHQRVKTPGGPIWIRVDYITCAGLIEALGKATPLGEEIVLNTIEAPK